MVSKLLFHVVAAVHFAYGCYYDFTFVQIPSSVAPVAPVGGKLKYLTYINALIQTLYYTVSALNDVFGSNEQLADSAPKPFLRKLKDALFCSLAFPLSMFVGITFWGIYAIDRELILPTFMDKYFPMWLNHVMHTNIMLFTVAELVTSFRMYPNRKKGVLTLVMFMVCYAIWVHYIYFKSGHWVYPILKVLNWPMRVFFYIISLGIVSSFYVMGEKCNRAVWSEQVALTEKSGKKKAK